MNLGVFNRVNWKEAGGDGMYGEWASLSGVVMRGGVVGGGEGGGGDSVLSKLGASNGRDVAVSVVKQLAANLGIAQAAEPSSLTTDREVQWCMEVICYGLSLPLSEHEAIKDCVNVYCEWMTCLHPIPKLSVPRPVCEDPNLYARKMIGHFHNLFVPRKGEVWTFLYLDLSMDTINRQAVLCHRVLRTLQQVAQLSTSMDRQTWETLLLFLLAINDTLLAPPTVKDDVGDKLCERVLSVLFEVWLLACVHCFPSPPLWKTLREMSMNWRHRVALVEQWNRVNLALTQRLLDFMYGPSFPQLKILEDDIQLIPEGMSNDCVAQCWFRLLHCIGNPVDLCRPQVISQTQKFLQFAITSDSVVDPCQHPCLAVLPHNFLKAIKGIAGQVDAFLGIATQPITWDDSGGGGGGGEGKKGGGGGGDAPSHSPTPPTQRRLAKSFSVAPSTVTKGIPKASLIALTTSRASAVSHPPPPTPGNSGPSSTSSVTSLLSLGCEVRTPLAPCRPKSNSILHLFGEWLFEAAQIGTPLYRSRLGNRDSRPSSVRLDSVGSTGSTNRKGSLSTTSQPGSLTDDLDGVGGGGGGTSPYPSPGLSYQSGRAEAIGALCRIFCAKKTGEEILSVYYARFYLTLQQGLKVIDYSLPPPSTPGRECEETLSSILVNSPDLLRLDLDGIQILVPSLIDALEIVLPEKDLNLKSPSVSKVELRRNSIHLLLSMLVLPLHYQNLPIKPLLGHESIPLTFSQLKPRLMNLLINALQVETDPQNTQMLLGGLLLSVQDSATFEESDQVTQPDVLSASGSDSTSNLLSSADSMSSVSGMSDGTITEEQDGGSNVYYTDGEHSYVINAPNKHSAHGLLVRATYLVCHRLISSWKTDLNVSLAALELLSGLARVHIRDTDALECKRAVKWICDYIVYQCGRPPPAHSKDLHSTIVAAFQCAAVWLLAHPYILQDKDWLQTLFEVVELGISGSKSQGKPGEKIKLKDEKELKPVSMRVRDAAEFLLSVILEQVGYMPSPCGAESLSCLLDEVALAKQCNSASHQLSQQSAVAKFRYFVLENSTVLALLEEPLGNDQDPQPTVTVLIRGAFGRHAWTLQLRHLPRHKSGGSKCRHVGGSPGRPVPMHDAGTVRAPPRTPKHFPDAVERIPQCKVDRSIPELDSLLMDDPSGELNELSRLIERQSVAERSDTSDSVARNKATVARQHDTDAECTPPPLCHEFQTARLFLSHFGFLSRLDNTQPTSVPPLVALDTSSSSFCSDLAALDTIGSRTCDTCHVFYVRAGQKQADHILSNVISDSTVSPHFLEMLLSLGWPVTVGQHPGWTGQLETSWKITPTQTNADLEDHGQHGGSLYNGNSHVIYWADVSSEIAFVVPTLSNVKKHTEKDFQTDSSRGAWFERSVSVSGDKPRNMSLELDGSKEKWSRRHPPTPVLVVWLESFEDHLHFPLVDMMPYISTGLEPESQGHLPRSQDCFVIFLHALHSGLLRVRLQGPSGRMSLATPLVDGMVISRRVVGSLVRQTALNMCRRRRLDNDNYQPPHVRRRLKVQEMVSKYRCEMTFPELLTYLLSNEKKNDTKESSSGRK
ncbi:ral GTPase-activating protein subunit beta isoform X3 [Nilaparvata lugens]|uniref:ral GTPase-activating protein subunit beta isoform X3 n=1 Tax=Nilaparvata lugens TaxID=108931 RepID=UPI00193EC093|nr:ral GTPase-activating protein subunit beta isoform X3 [Nilaparvata lugens]